LSEGFGWAGRQIPSAGKSAAKFLFLLVILIFIGKVRNPISGHPFGPGHFC
jgi:hypothetical protein